jgi:hypothetical protein
VSPSRQFTSSALQALRDGKVKKRDEHLDGESRVNITVHAVFTRQ